MDTTPHHSDCSQQLLHLEHARRALSEANTVTEIKAVREKAESVRTHAQKASLGFDIQNFAAELKLQAERVGGQLLNQMKLRGGPRTGSNHAPQPSLKDLGIDKNQSARWQLEASVPEPVFRDFVRSSHAAGKEISASALIRIAKSLKERTYDDFVISELPLEFAPISLKSHLLSGDWQSLEPLHSGVAELSELVAEIRNHHYLLTNLVDAVCKQAALTPVSVDYRAIQRYLREIDCHLREIDRGLRRLRHDATLPGNMARTNSF